MTEGTPRGDIEDTSGGPRDTGAGTTSGDTGLSGAARDIAVGEQTDDGCFPESVPERVRLAAIAAGRARRAVRRRSAIVRLERRPAPKGPFE